MRRIFAAVAALTLLGVAAPAAVAAVHHPQNGPVYRKLVNDYSSLNMSSTRVLYSLPTMEVGWLSFTAQNPKTLGGVTYYQYGLFGDTSRCLSAYVPGAVVDVVNCTTSNGRDYFRVVGKTVQNAAEVGQGTPCIWSAGSAGDTIQFVSCSGIGSKGEWTEPVS